MAIYQRRRDKLVAGLAKLGLRVQVPQASFYIWARVPEGYTSAEYCAKLIDEVAVVVTPGSGYGQQGGLYPPLLLPPRRPYRRSPRPHRVPRPMTHTPIASHSKTPRGIWGGVQSPLPRRRGPG